jgi:hypothetical protein
MPSANSMISSALLQPVIQILGRVRNSAVVSPQNLAFRHRPGRTDWEWSKDSWRQSSKGFNPYECLVVLTEMPVMSFITLTIFMLKPATCLGRELSLSSFRCMKFEFAVLLLRLRDKWSRGLQSESGIKHVWQFGFSKFLLKRSLVFLYVRQNSSERPVIPLHRPIKSFLINSWWPL